MANDGTLKELPDVPLHENNWFKSREEAIVWLTRMHEADEEFAAPHAMVLQEHFFTNS